MSKFLVLQSDFGLVDGAVSAMEGVAYGVDPTLTIAALTHDITPYNIFEASYRLFQTVKYWPQGTVFVSVCDPGVGSKRKSVVARTSSGHYIVTPNNGTLTHIHQYMGIEEIREIEEKVNRLADSFQSYTFHGRDVYAYTGARLASGVITYEQVGPQLPLEEIIDLPIFNNKITETSIIGQIDILDVRFGSLWTSITFDEFKTLNIEHGDNVGIKIYKDGNLVYYNMVTYGFSFADVMVGMPILYMNSVYNMALAINQGSFAKAYGIGVGSAWTIELIKLEK